MRGSKAAVALVGTCNSPVLLGLDKTLFSVRPSVELPPLCAETWTRNLYNCRHLSSDTAHPGVNLHALVTLLRIPRFLTILGQLTVTNSQFKRS